MLGYYRALSRELRVFRVPGDRSIFDLPRTGIPVLSILGSLGSRISAESLG